MRKTLTFALVCAFCAAIYAGPEQLPYSGKEMKQVAPAPEPTCFNWSGFYVGGFGGFKFSSVDVDLDLGGEWDATPEDRDIVESRGSKDLDNSGGEVGGLIGYNFQWNCWVLGLEADGGYLWARESNVTETFSVPVLLDKQVRTSFKTHYLATFGPRFGYAFGRLLPYVTGGLAIGDLDFYQDVRSPHSDFIQRGSVDDTNAGWMIGGGLQYALTDHWSIRGQYQFIDLGDVDFESEGNVVPTTGHHEVELREHNVSFAIMYKF